MNESESEKAVTERAANEKHGTGRPKQLWAKILSDVFSPLLVPTYGMAMAMWLTSLRAVPERSRLVVTLIVAVITAVLPMTAILSLRSMGKVSDLDISRRGERTVPYIVSAACYLAAAFFLVKVRAPLWLVLFFVGAALAVAIATVITLRWKISAHSTAMGGLTGMMLWFAAAGLADVNAMALLSGGIIASGAVATARIELGCHTLWQTLAGLALGFACTFGVELLF